MNLACDGLDLSHQVRMSLGGINNCAGQMLANVLSRVMSRARRREDAGSELTCTSPGRLEGKNLSGVGKRMAAQSDGQSRPLQSSHNPIRH